MAHYCDIDPAFTITQKNRFGSFLINSLRHKLQIEVENKKYTIAEKVDTLYISIPEHYERNYGINISVKHQYWFNRFLQEEFQDKMLMFVAPKLDGKKGTIKPELMKFREFYKIDEDDLPFLSLKKMWERNQHRLEHYRNN